MRRLPEPIPDSLAMVTSAKLTRVMRVRPAAQLPRVVADRDDTYLVAVLFAEHHDRTHLTRLVHGHDFPVDGQVVHAAIVDDVHHRLELRRVQTAGMVEVEAQLVRADVRALLAGGLAEHVLQRAMQQMGGRVMPTRAIAARDVNFGAGQLARTKFALDMPEVDDVAGSVDARVVDDEHAAGRANGAGVADLAAAFGIEG